MMNPYKVALVMIARNEAARIVRALASVANCVDELVVLDTGSTDATVALARSAGARVGHFTWCDDFAAARNAALKLADADWAIVVDADEWIAEAGIELLALRHTKPDFVGTLRVDSQFDTPIGVSVSPSWLPRVLPRGVRYEGHVHEQPKHELPVRRLPTVLAHDGYLSKALKAKAGRNADLLARALAQPPDDAVVLCCFNQTYKLSPNMLDLWSRILADAPRAVLWMLAWNPHAKQNLLRELAARGVAPERVFFADKLDLPSHLARLRAADLFLDTWPCNAHTTASEALWAGVPVLTVPGATFASRVAASLATACGLGDLACRSEADYVELAIALANEPDTLRGIKAHLDVNRRTLPLFDAERLARDMDALLTRMHERHLAGLAPQALPAVAAEA